MITPDRPPPDEHLLARMALGDTEALEILRARHAHAAYSEALSVLGDPATATHAVSEAFLEAFRLAAEFKPARGPVDTWVVELTRRRADAAAARYGTKARGRWHPRRRTARST